jgi:IPT/TIG domain
MRTSPKTILLCLAALLAGLLALTAACSDDDPPPIGDTGVKLDGSSGDGIKKDGAGGDSLNPCPMPGPCVLSKVGEGKHADNQLVIGERMTLTGKELKTVDTVYVGAAVAPLVSVSDTKVVCRIGPRTPPGEQTIELKAGTSRRMSGLIKVSRLALATAADHIKVQSFHTNTHSGALTLDLAEAPAARPTLSASGRYLVAQGKSKLMLADLALEQAAQVGGLGSETAASWTVDSKDTRLLIATVSGKLFVADLAGFPTLIAAAVSGAPKTALVGLAAAGLIIGVGSTGQVWYAAEDLKTFTTVKSGSTPIVLGSGGALTPGTLDTRDDLLAALAHEGSDPYLGLLEISSGTPAKPASLKIPGALGAVVARGGAQVALSGEGSAPALSYVTAASPTSAKSITLGGSGASRVLARALPGRSDEVLALVGPKPTTGTFIASVVEWLDLAQGKRLVTSGSQAVIELSDLRDGAGDPLNDELHVITGTHYRSYGLSIAGTAVTSTEKHPSQLLDAGKDYRWLLVQP